MNQETEAPGAIAPTAMDPIEAGLRLFFVDVGMSISFFMIVGLIMLLAGSTTNDILGNRTFEFVGSLISLYAAFLLRKKYSENTKALLAIIVTSVVIGAADMFISSIKHIPVDATTDIVSLATGIAAYCLGWYIAALTPLRLWLLNKTWTTVFFWIGIVSLVIGWI